MNHSLWFFAIFLLFEKGLLQYWQCVLTKCEWNLLCNPFEIFKFNPKHCWGFWECGITFSPDIAVHFQYVSTKKYIFLANSGLTVVEHPSGHTVMRRVFYSSSLLSPQSWHKVRWKVFFISLSKQFKTTKQNEVNSTTLHTIWQDSHLSFGIRNENWRKVS